MGIRKLLVRKLSSDRLSPQSSGASIPVYSANDVPWSNAFRDVDDYRTLWAGAVRVRQQNRANETGLNLAEGFLRKLGLDEQKEYLLMLSVEAILLYTVGIDPVATTNVNPLRKVASSNSLAGISDDSKGSDDQIFCAMVPFVQVIEVLRLGAEVHVVYTPNVLQRFSKRQAIKRLLPPMTPFPKSLKSKTTDRNSSTVKTAVKTGDRSTRDGNRLVISLAEVQDAQQLALLLDQAVRRFVCCMSVLDKGLPPPPEDTQLLAVSWQMSGQQGQQTVLASLPQCRWGVEVKLPWEWLQASSSVCGSSRGSVSNVAGLRCYLYTPLGPAYAVLRANRILRASQSGDGVISCLATVQLPWASKEKGSPSGSRKALLTDAVEQLSVTITCRVSAGTGVLQLGSPVVQTPRSLRTDSSRLPSIKSSHERTGGESLLLVGAVLGLVALLLAGIAEGRGFSITAVLTLISMLLLLAAGWARGPHFSSPVLPPTPLSNYHPRLPSVTPLVTTQYNDDHDSLDEPLTPLTARSPGAFEGPFNGTMHGTVDMGSSSFVAAVGKPWPKEEQEEEEEEEEEGGPLVSVQLLACEIVEVGDGIITEVADAKAEAEWETSSVILRSVITTGIDLPSNIRVAKKAFEDLAKQHPWCTPDIMSRYLLATKGNELLALQRLRATLEWRQSEDIGSLLTAPQPVFDIIKRNYCHGFHCRAKDGTPVWIEKVGTFRQSYLDSAAEGVSDEDHLRHMIFLSEWLISRVCPEPLPKGKHIKILDAKGVSIGDIRGPAWAFIQKMFSVLPPNYIERLHTAFIVNAPSWWGLIWKMAAALVDQRTRDKVYVLSGPKETLDTLSQFLHVEDIPMEYGGTCTRPVAESEFEIELKQYVATVCNAS